jgi:MoaA/NifB/PqqE/SkfB family radical SAM enzyme
VSIFIWACVFIGYVKFALIKKITHIYPQQALLFTSIFNYYPMITQTSKTPVVKSNDQLMKGLNFLWLELTLKCNLTCVHCYADSSPHQPLTDAMTNADWKKVMLNAYQEGCRALQFIGGEVTMYPELEGFIKYADELGYTYIEVFTNATLIDSHWIKLFKQHKVHLASSFYSADASVHDQITKRKGSFEKTVQGINQLVQNQIPLRVGVIEMEHNQGHLANATRLLQALGVKSISSDNLRGVGRGHRSTTKAQTNELCGNCWKGKLCVTSSGDTYPCVFSRGFKVGNVKEQSINEIVNGQNLKETRATLCQSALARKKSQEEGCNPQIVDKAIEKSQDCFPKIDLVQNDMCGPDRIDHNIKEDSCFPKIDLVQNDMCGPDRIDHNIKEDSCFPKIDLMQNDMCGPDRIDHNIKEDSCFPKIDLVQNDMCGPDRIDGCNPQVIDQAAQKDQCTPNLTTIDETLKNVEKNSNTCGPDRIDGCNPQVIDLAAQKDQCTPNLTIMNKTLKKVEKNSNNCGPDRIDGCNPQVIDQVAQKDQCTPNLAIMNETLKDAEKNK